MEALADGDPKTIGRYRLEARLGRGGMGEVYLGRSPGGRAVAVKVVRSELAADRQFQQRFAAEVEAARRVGGFHTTPVVDADPHGSPPWLVTAYIPGPSLADAIAEHGALPETSLRVLAAGLAEALEAIHAAGLVHRDLKPSNILLASDGPRVIDFGIARALDATALTRTGASVGTPGFMAPEQVTGEGAIGPAADVFAFGSVLCHASGIRPFGEGPTTAMLYRIVHQEPDLTGLPDGLRELVTACLAKDPAARPTPAALLEELSLSGPSTRSWLPQPVQTMLTHHAVQQPSAGPGEQGRVGLPTPQPDVQHPRTRVQPDGVRFQGSKDLKVASLIGYAVRLGVGLTVVAVCFKQVVNDGSGGLGFMLLTLLGIWFSVTSARGFWSCVSVLSRPYDLGVGPQGLDLRYAGRHTYYRWKDLNRVAVRRGTEKRGWVVSVALVPGTAPAPLKDFRTPLPYLEKKSGWIVVAPVRELKTGRAEIEETIARYAGPRWGGNA